MDINVNRAVPLGIIGGVVGALLVLVLRSLQGLDPVWEAGVGIVSITLFAAGFFMWGIGAFNPKLSEHADETAIEPVEGDGEKTEEEPAPPGQLVLGLTYQLTTFVLIGLLVIGVFAILPNFVALTTTEVPEASVSQVGYTTLEVFGTELQVSQMVIFIGFIGVMMVSLVAAAGVIGYLLHGLSKGVQEAAYEAATGQKPALPAGEVRALPPGEQPVVSPALTEGSRDILVLLGRLVVAVIAAVVLYVALDFIMPVLLGTDEAPGIRNVLVLFNLVLIGAIVAAPRFRRLALIIVVAEVLFLVFYWALIGLVIDALPLPREPWLTIISAVNVLVIIAIVFFPKDVLRLIGRVAKWGAWALRGGNTVADLERRRAASGADKK